MYSGVVEMRFNEAFQKRRHYGVELGSRNFQQKIFVTSGSAKLLLNNRFRSSSAVEQLPVKQLVAGSIPASGAHTRGTRDTSLVK